MNDPSDAALSLVRSIYGNLAEYYRFLGRSPTVELHDTRQLAWVNTGIPDAFLNRVFRTRLADGAVGRVIEETLAHFRSRNVPLAWMTEPDALPMDLAQRLCDHGAVYSAGLSGMAADLRNACSNISVPSALRIEAVDNTRSLEQWVIPYARGFRLEAFRQTLLELEASLGVGPDLPRRHAVGLLAGEPVGSATVFFGTDVAGIYNVATAPEARRRGIGTAMTLHCLSAARKAGYRTAVLEASVQGWTMYRRIGFAHCCEIAAYLWPLETGSRPTA